MRGKHRHGYTNERSNESIQIALLHLTYGGSVPKICPLYFLTISNPYTLNNFVRIESDKNVPNECLQEMEEGNKSTQKLTD